MGWTPLEMGIRDDDFERWEKVLVKKDEGGYVVAKANHHPISRFTGLREAVSYAKSVSMTWHPSDEVARELDNR